MDFYREWKPAQRLFRDVKTAVNQRLALDNLPNPKTLAHEPYFPRNSPAIGDLMTMFRFPGNITP